MLIKINRKGKRVGIIVGKKPIFLTITLLTFIGLGVYITMFTNIVKF